MLARAAAAPVASAPPARTGLGWRRGLGRVGLALGTAWSLLSVSTLAVAQTPMGVDGWLAAARGAAAQQSFSGHYVVTGEGGANSSRIVHYGQGRDSYERIESLDGTPRVVLRHNETVHTVWPRERVTVVEQRSLFGSFPTPAPALGHRLDDHYRVSAVSTGRVAGRDADVVTVQARDDWRYGHRLYIDSETRLLLRSDVLGPRDQVLASSAFTDVSIGVKPQPTRVLAAMKARGDDWRVVPSTLQTTTLQAEGWRIEPLPPGWRLLTCVRRALQPLNGIDAARPAVLQAIFSDGLASVSVFIEEASDAAAPSGMLQTGSTTTVMHHRDRHRVTVVGDLPPKAARHLAELVQRRAP